MFSFTFLVKEITYYQHCTSSLSSESDHKNILTLSLFHYHGNGKIAQVSVTFFDVLCFPHKDNVRYGGSMLLIHSCNAFNLCDPVTYYRTAYGFSSAALG